MSKVRTIDDDGDAMLAPGDTLVVSMAQMSDSQMTDSATAQRKPAQQIIAIADGAMHRPGYAVLSDTDINAKQAAYNAYERRMATAFKDVPTLTDKKVEPTAIKAADSREQMYAEVERRLRDAWRHA